MVCARKSIKLKHICIQSHFSGSLSVYYSIPSCTLESPGAFFFFNNADARTIPETEPAICWRL